MATERKKKNKEEKEVFFYQTLPPRSSLTRKQRTKLEKISMRGPTEKDTIGYIYMFDRPLVEKFEGLIKIGRTAKLPEKRVKQWGSSSSLILSYEVKRPAHKYAEYLIHLHLKDVQVPQWVTKDGNMKLETEWFRISRTEAERVIREVVRELNITVPPLVVVKKKEEKKQQPRVIHVKLDLENNLVIIVRGAEESKT